MLNRRQLRLKVMEVIYAYDKSIEKNIDYQIKYFLNSNKNFYSLYITILSFLNKLYIYCNERNFKNNKKFLKNDKDNFYNKFSNNLFIKKLSSDKILLEKIDLLKINYWDDHPEYIDSLVKKIEKSDIFLSYYQLDEDSFEKDKQFVINIFKKIIASDNKLYEFFEETQISWVNDLPLVNSLVLSTLKKIQKRSRKSCLITKVYKNEEDSEFGIDLLKQVILNKEILKKEIGKVTSNWDSERIAQIDLILLQMCLTEFLFFDSIPVKVSINEYLELAKEYSSPKSNIFINGIMDAISKQFTLEGRIKKNKRGLQ